MRSLARRAGLAAAAAIALLPAAAMAQRSVAPTWEPARDARFWIASGALLAAAVPLDRCLRDLAAAHHGRAADRLAADIDPLGRARDILPALVVTVVGPRLLGQRRVSAAAMRVALSYLAADAVESALKPAVGRHRPSDGRGPLRFRPFSPKEEWHSFPSAHVAHAVALAAGLSGETRSPWLAGAAYGVAGLVGAQRVYRGAHWTSDVVASAALAAATASTTDAWLRRRGLGRLLPAATLEALPGGVRVRWSF